MTSNNSIIFCEQIERIKLSRKALSHFAILAIVNKILISKNR